MNLETLIAVAKEQGASDLHLEATLPAALRVRGALRTVGEPIPAKDLIEANRDKLEIIAKSLLEYETLDGTQVEDIVRTGKFTPTPPPPLNLEPPMGAPAAFLTTPETVPVGVALERRVRS